MIGYNYYQVNQFVFGLEDTVDGTSVSNTVQAVFPIAFGGSTLSAHTSSEIQGSICGRAGIAWERALIYATGGVAFGGFNTKYSLLGNAYGFIGTWRLAPQSVLSSWFEQLLEHPRGWTVGGGIDYAVTNNWSLFAEYRYTNFGSISAPCWICHGARPDERVHQLKPDYQPKIRFRSASATSSTWVVRRRSSRNIKVSKNKNRPSGRFSRGIKSLSLRLTLIGVPARSWKTFAG